jgi:hypothetical protein
MVKSTQWVDPVESWPKGWQPYQPQDRSRVSYQNEALRAAAAQPLREYQKADYGQSDHSWLVAGTEADQQAQATLEGNSVAGTLRAAEASLEMGAIPTLLGRAYEAWQYQTDLSKRERYGEKAIGRVMGQKEWNGLTEAERTYIEESWNEEHARFRWEKLKGQRELLEKAGAGGLTQQLVGGLLGSLPEGVALGMVGGGLANMGVRAAQRSLATGATSNLATKVIGTRIGGAVAGNLLGGTVPEAIAYAVDPYRGLEDILGATFFDIGGSLGAIKGAGVGGAWAAAGKELGHTLTNLDIKMPEWMRRGKTDPASTPGATPESPIDASGAVEKSQEGTDPTQTPESPVEPPVAPEAFPAQSKVVRDVSWASPEELENLGLSDKVIYDGSGRAQQVSDHVNFWELPAGWVDSSGQVSRGVAEVAPPRVDDGGLKRMVSGVADDGLSPAEASEMTIKGDQHWRDWKEWAQSEAGGRRTDEEAELSYLQARLKPAHPGSRLLKTPLRDFIQDGNLRMSQDLPNEIQQAVKAFSSDINPHAKVWVVHEEAKHMNGNLGDSWPVGSDIVLIRVSRGLKGPDGVATAIHELAHSFTTRGLVELPKEIRDKWGELVRKTQAIMEDPNSRGRAWYLRFGTPENVGRTLLGLEKDPQATLLNILGGDNKYWGNAQEITAEAAVRYAQRRYVEFMGVQGTRKARKHEYIPVGLIKWAQRTARALQDSWDKFRADPVLNQMDADWDEVFKAIGDNNEAKARAGVTHSDPITDPAAYIWEQTSTKDPWASKAPDPAALKDPETSPGGSPDLPKYADWVQAKRAREQEVMVLPEQLAADIKKHNLGLEEILPDQPKESPEVKQAKAEEGSTDDEMQNPDRPDFKYKVSPQGHAYGLDLVNQSNQAEVAAVIMMDRAVQTAIQNAPPPNIKERSSRVLQGEKFRDATKGGFDKFVSASQIALQSKNPVIRYFAWVLGESPSNLTGKRQNRSAAIASFHNERYILQDATRGLQDAQALWAKENGYSTWNRLTSPEAARKFDKELQEWLYKTSVGDGKKAMIPDDAPDSMVQAITTLRDAYARANEIEHRYRLPGTQADLPDPLGYMPRVLDPEKIANLTVGQKRMVVDEIYKQLMGLGTFSPVVARETAVRYLDRAEKARGGVFTPQKATIDNEDSVRVVQALLKDQGFKEEEVAQMTGPILHQKQSHFYRKLRLDENKDLGDGITLGDLMWTDHTALLRQHARSSAGWAAMAEQGIYGYEGMRAVLAAASKGSGDMKGTKAELDALSQIMSEVSNVPLNEGQGHYYSSVLQGAMQATSILRLGGLAWTQSMEILNVAAHIGGMNALQALPHLRRLRKELLHIAKTGDYGAAKGLLGELEEHMGVAFGTDGYFLPNPWDTEGRSRDIRGSQENSKVFRFLNSASHAQGIMSGMRAILGTQQRFAAHVTLEQALNRAMKLSEPDTWMKDIGFDGEMFQKLKAVASDPAIVIRDDSGKAVQFNARRVPPEFLDAIGERVYRSVNQMIQGSFAGEKGAYVHDSLWQTLTQFRAFSFLALEKQLGRQVGNYGYAKAAMILATTMAAAMPIVMLRALIQSLGKDEEGREKYLKERLHPMELIKASANYVALAGFLPDIIDAFQDVTGQNTGPSRKLLGDRIAPSVGLINDLYEAPHNYKKALGLIPGATLPFMIPVMNGIKTGVDSLTDEED